jgi:hypothetical protein
MYNPLCYLASGKISTHFYRHNQENKQSWIVYPMIF